MGLILTFIRLDSHRAALFTTVQPATPRFTAVNLTEHLRNDSKNNKAQVFIKIEAGYKILCLPFNGFKSLIRKNVKITFCKQYAPTKWLGLLKIPCPTPYSIFILQLQKQLFSHPAFQLLNSILIKHTPTVAKFQTLSLICLISVKLPWLNYKRRAADTSEGLVSAHLIRFH